MKKIIAYIITIISIVVIGITAFLFYLKLKPPKLYDTSGLTTIEVNGQNYKTTGAIPSVDVASQKSLDEVVQLSNAGEIGGTGYKISVGQQGQVMIDLQKPYDTNKTKAMTWLKENGYGDITPDQITFVEQ